MVVLSAVEHSLLLLLLLLLLLCWRSEAAVAP
jgi:hypothetical protein